MRPAGQMWENLVMTLVPRRAMIVSADVGEGHNAAG
jgi:hypothetical protein